MALSDVDICNVALGWLGNDPITAMTDREVKASRCRQFYASTRDACLARFPWSFATRRKKMAISATVPEFGYLYNQAKPPDCLRVLRVTSELDDIDGPELGTEGPDYREEGSFILTNFTPAYIRYIGREELTGKYSPLFIEYFAATLAAHLAPGLVKAVATSKNMFALAESFLQTAMDVDRKTKGTQSVRVHSTWKDARNV